MVDYYVVGEGIFPNGKELATVVLDFHPPEYGRVSFTAPTVTSTHWKEHGVRIVSFFLARRGL